MIIDSHTHLMQQFGYRKGLDIHEHMALLRSGGVDKAVLMTTDGFLGDYKFHNDLLLESYRAYPDSVIPFCTLNPRDPGALDELIRCHAAGMRGIKFHPWLQAFAIVDDMMEPIVQKAVELDMPIFSHDGTPPYSTSLQVAYWAGRYPKVKIVLGHGGLRDFAREALLAAKRYENVYLGFCGAIFQMMKDSVKAVGSHRCLFGSDSPFQGAEYLMYEIQKVKCLGLSKKDEDDILGGNLARMIGMEVSS